MERMVKDPYTVLGVAKDAAPGQIKKAYHKLARTLHPDLNPGDKQAEDRFKEVSAAYDLLSDAEKKARYDRGEIDASGAEKPRWQNRAAGAKGGKPRDGFGFGDLDIDDILGDLLRRRGPGGGAGAGSRGPFGGAEFRMRGADANYSLRVPFVEACLGATKRITLPSGRSLDVRIPPGTEDGQTLRLRHQGAPGASGGEAGDAYVEIQVEAHPFFTRQGNDIHVEVPVTLPEAVLGGKINVPTLSGRVSLSIPPAANTGTALRLKGKGVPHGRHHGDQLVKLRVMLPDHPDSDLEGFLREWAKTHDYDVRGKLGMG